MLVNTQYFREQAIHFEKHGKYPCGVKGSSEYKKWWLQERDRCLYGYSVGGIWITGYHYYYLNYCPIQIVERLGDTRAGSRKLGFPKFWDVDYMFFQSVHIAKYGVTIEELDNLAYSIPLQRDEFNLSGGHHLVFLKPRGIGASYKNGSMASRNFHLYSNSRTFMFAHDKEYLNKDGIYTKFQEYRSWINTNASGFKSSSDFKADQTNMHFRNSYDADGEGNEKGLMSEVIGVTVNGKADKGRGKRGILLLFEEAGRFAKMEDVWNIARRSMEEDGIVYGTMIAFGTGGTEGADFSSMEKMFNTPRAYNILAFDNIWDLGKEGTDCGMFIPADHKVQYTDKDGNSDIEIGKKLVKEEITASELSPDPTLVLKTKAELPMTPRDAMLNTMSNKFASEELTRWRDTLANNGYYKQFGTPKTLFVNERGEIETKLETIIQPIVNYPHNQKQDLRGCVIEYDTPYVDPETKEIPDSLYYICLDPFADDDVQDKTSLGAAYVVEQFNNLTSTKGDRIVASYIGRPNKTDDFNRVLFLLARRWNAKIGYENDRGGNVLDYAKRFRLTNWLHEEFELSWDDSIKVKNKSTVKYGMRIGSGKNNIKLLTGDSYLKDWLYQERGETEKGEIKYNFHYIYDIGLLDELRLYDGIKNSDRISSLRIGMFQQKEMIYNESFPTKKEKKFDDFDKFVARELGEHYEKEDNEENNLEFEVNSDTFGREFFK